MSEPIVGPFNHAQTTHTPDLPKHVRESLCLAQAALADRIRAGQDILRCYAAIDQIGTLIDRVDEHRPEDVGGKHRELHTATCGCDGHIAPWSITLFPAHGGDHTEGDRS